MVTDIDISYEDGLRLSELNGEMSRLVFELDHILTTHPGIICSALFLSFVLAMFMAFVLQDENRPGQGVKAFVIVMVVGTVLLTLLFYPFVDAGIQASMAQTQGQIDTILERYT